MKIPLTQRLFEAVIAVMKNLLYLKRYKNSSLCVYFFSYISRNLERINISPNEKRQLTKFWLPFAAATAATP